MAEAQASSTAYTLSLAVGGIIVAAKVKEGKFKTGNSPVG